MGWIRWVSGAVLVAALGVASSNAGQRVSSFPPALACTASALRAPYGHPERVDSVQRFGCVGPWAYLWATVGSGVAEVSVTEVEHFDRRDQRWVNVDRLTYCASDLVPAYVKHWGCHSN